MAQYPLSAIIAKMFGTNTQSQLQVGADSDLIVSALHGTKYHSAKRGNLFTAANQTGATTSAALATTYTGLCLSNPAGTGKNLALRRIGFVLNVAPAALTSFGLITGFAAGGVTVHTTALTPASSKIGSGLTAVAKADAACTLVGTPVWSEWLTVTPAATSVVGFTADMEGDLIIPPGGYVAIGTSIAGPTNGLLASMEWEEYAV